MAKRGSHETSEVFARETIANPNPVGTNAPEGFLLDWWNISYEILSSTFPKVSLTMENIVPNINPENSTYTPNHMGENISNVMASYPVMLSPHLLSSFGTIYVLLDLSPPRDMTSGLQFPDMNEMGGMLPLASNSGLWDYTNIVMNFSVGLNLLMDLIPVLIGFGTLMLSSLEGNNRSLNKHLIKDDHLFQSTISKTLWAFPYTQYLTGFSHIQPLMVRDLLLLLRKGVVANH